MICFKKKYYLILLVFVITQVSCKDKSDENTYTTGKVEVLVDKTVLPTIEEEVRVFESQYDAQIILIPTSEANAVNRLLNNRAENIAILARDLTEKEKKYIKERKNSGVSTKIYKEGIALLVNKNAKDSLFNLSQVYNYIKGNQKALPFNTMVFDSSGSSTISYLMKNAQLDTLNNPSLRALSSNEAVINYISDSIHTNSIGLVGISWLIQNSSTKKSELLKNLQLVGLRNKSGLDSIYYKPTQSNIAAGNYPLIREVFILNYQPRRELGSGFATFIRGEIGQRIILKAGLVPIQMPRRELNVREDL